MENEENVVRKETGSERFKEFIEDNIRGVLCYSAICVLIAIGLYSVVYAARLASSLSPTKNGLETKIITELELQQDVVSCRNGDIHTASKYYFYIESPEGSKFQKLSADRVLIKKSSDDSMSIEGYFNDRGNCQQSSNLEYTIYVPEGKNLLSTR